MLAGSLSPKPGVQRKESQKAASCLPELAFQVPSLGILPQHSPHGLADSGGSFLPCTQVPAATCGSYGNHPPLREGEDSGKPIPTKGNATEFIGMQRRLSSLIL